jgi:hypothetical protein
MPRRPTPCRAVVDAVVPPVGEIPGSLTRPGPDRIQSAMTAAITRPSTSSSPPPQTPTAPLAASFGPTRAPCSSTRSRIEASRTAASPPPDSVSTSNANSASDGRRQAPSQHLHAARDLRPHRAGRATEPLGDLLREQAALDRELHDLAVGRRERLDPAVQPRTARGSRHAGRAVAVVREGAERFVTAHPRGPRRPAPVLAHPVVEDPDEPRHHPGARAERPRVVDRGQEGRLHDVVGRVDVRVRCSASCRRSDAVSRNTRSSASSSPLRRNLRKAASRDSVRSVVVAMPALARGGGRAASDRGFSGEARDSE